MNADGKKVYDALESVVDEKIWKITSQIHRKCTKDYISLIFIPINSIFQPENKIRTFVHLNVRMYGNAISREVSDGSTLFFFIYFQVSFVYRPSDE